MDNYKVMTINKMHGRFTGKIHPVKAESVKDAINMVLLQMNPLQEDTLRLIRGI